MNPMIIYGDVGELQEDNIRKQGWHKPKSVPIKICDLERHISPISCEFVIDEINGFMIFCSEATEGGKPYCPDHIHEMPSIKKLINLIIPLKDRIKDGSEKEKINWCNKRI